MVGKYSFSETEEVERDLQLRPAARRLPAQQVGHGHRQRRGELLDQGQLRLAAAVLQQGQGGGGPPYPGAKLGEGQAARPPQMAQTLAERRKV